MTVTVLEGLFDYGYWANTRLFSVLAALTPEQFTHDVAGSYGSVRNTLVHALSAEWGWFERCGGPTRGARLNQDDYPTPASLIEAWRAVEVRAREFLSTLRDEDLGRFVAYTVGTITASQPVGELLHHAAIHGIHHRGQAALQLRLLGCTPGNFDMLFYYIEKRGVAA